MCVFGVEGYSVRWQLVHTHVSGQTVTVLLVSYKKNLVYALEFHDNNSQFLSAGLMVVCECVCVCVCQYRANS